MADFSNEPSMEDILSSIKRIIADEGENGVSTRLRPTPRRMRESPRVEPELEPVAAPGIEEEEVLELTDPVDHSQAQREDEDAEDDAPELVSAGTASASRSALASLSALVVKAEQPAHTLEGLVREMLRPMLKEWLDSNLPELVETMVAKEIARISGKGL